MAAHRPVQITFATATEAAPLIQWLEDTRELAWLTHAPGLEDHNLAIQLSAAAMLKKSDPSWSLSTYNKTLAQQQWQAFRKFAFTSPGDYLLWHMASGQVDSASLLVRGANRIPVDDPYKGWSDGNSGSNQGWPSCAASPGLLHFHYSTDEAPDRIGGFSFIAQTHSRSATAPLPLKRFWARLKAFVKEQYGVA